MVKVKYSDVYTEVLAVLNNLKKEDYNKIPKNYIKCLEDNCNKNYYFMYDASKPFSEQTLMDDTKYILFGLFEKFGATEIQKEKIQNYRRNYYYQLEKQKSLKYGYDKIFYNEKKDDENSKTENSCNEKQLTKYKESIFMKLKKFILSIFQKK